MLKNNLHYPKWNCLACFPVQFHLHSEHIKIPRGDFFSQQMEMCEESKKTKNEGVPWWFSSYNLVLSLLWPRFSPKPGHSSKQKTKNKKEHKSIRANKKDSESKLED